MKYERSTVSEVHELLKEFGPGKELTVKEVNERIPWVEANHVSAALGLLSQERYGMLERLEKRGKIRPYRITENINDARREHKKPAYARRYRIHYDDGSRDTNGLRSPVPSIKGNVSDALLDAAMIAESGDRKSIDSVISIIRGVYLNLKDTRDQSE